MVASKRDASTKYRVNARQWNRKNTVHVKKVKLSVMVRNPSADFYENPLIRSGNIAI